MPTRQLRGIIAGALMIVGPFCPLVSLPFIGDITYFKNGEGDGTLVLICGVASLGLATAKRFQVLWVTGAASVGLVAFVLIRMKQKISELGSGLSSDLADNPFRGLAEVAAQSIQIKWGAAVLIAGGTLAMVAAAMRETVVEAAGSSDVVGEGVSDSRKCPYCAEIIKVEAVVCRFCGRTVDTSAGTKSE